MPLFLLVDNSLPTELKLAQNGGYLDIYAYVLKNLNTNELLFVKTFTPDLRLNQVVDIPDTDLFQQSFSKITIGEPVPEDDASIEFLFLDNLHLHNSLGPSLMVDDFCTARESLLAEIRQQVHGDSLASEYLLLFLLFKRTWSKSLDYSINGFSLKLSCSSMPSGLLKLLRDLSVHSFHLPLSIEYMNKKLLYSKYHPDGVTSLTPGVLQLPEHSIVTMDTFDLKEGQLNAQGLQNYQCLVNAIQTNTMDCVPSGNVSIPFSFNLDLSYLLIVPEEKPFLKKASNKEFIPTDIHIPVLKFSISADTKTTKDISNAQLKHYIGACKSLAEKFRILPETEKYIQNAFVKDRQNSREAQDELNNLMKSETDLSRRLTLAKWLAISHGSSALEPRHWDDASLLEQTLVNRFLHLNAVEVTGK